MEVYGTEYNSVEGMQHTNSDLYADRNAACAVAQRMAEESAADMNGNAAPQERYEVQIVGNAYRVVCIDTVNVCTTPFIVDTWTVRTFNLNGV